MLFDFVCLQIFNANTKSLIFVLDIGWDALTFLISIHESKFILIAIPRPLSISRGAYTGLILALSVTIDEVRCTPLDILISELSSPKRGVIASGSLNSNSPSSYLIGSTYLIRIRIESFGIIFAIA